MNEKYARQLIEEVRKLREAVERLFRQPEKALPRAPEPAQPAQPTAIRRPIK